MATPIQTIHDDSNVLTHVHCGFAKSHHVASVTERRRPLPLLLCVALFVGCSSADPELEPNPDTASSTDTTTASPDETIPTTARSTTRRDVGPSNPAPAADRSSNFVQKEKIERHPNGKVRRGYEARFYPDGEMVFHGRYVEFWESGKKHSKGRYAEGKKEGEWTYWYPNGRVAKKGGFIQGKLEGRWIYVTDDGRPKHRDHYKDGKRHGELIVFDKATGTKVVRKVSFKDGMKHGVATEYFANGNVMRSTNWANGEEHGKQETFYDNGKKLMLEEFSHGKLHGQVIKWSPLGSVQSKVRYENGVPQKK